MVITACTGAVAGSPGLSSAFIASVSELSASLGWALSKVRTAPVPCVAGAPGHRARGHRFPGQERRVAVAVRRHGQPQRPHAGRFRPANPLGLVCRPGSAAQFWLPRADASSGRTASTTGDVTSERLSVIVFCAVAPASRAAETELPGIHNAGCPPSSAGHLPMKPFRTASEPAGLTLTSMQWSPTGPAEEL